MLTVHYLHYGGCQLIQVRGLSAPVLLLEGIPGTAVVLHSTSVWRRPGTGWGLNSADCGLQCKLCPGQYSTGLQESHKTNELALPIHHLYSPPSYTLSSHRGWILWTSSADPGSRVATADNLDIDVYLGGILALAPASCSKHAPRLASFKSLLKPHYKLSFKHSLLTKNFGCQSITPSSLRGGLVQHTSLIGFLS